MVLYVAKRFETNIAACVHRAAIEEMAGKEQVFVVNLRMDDPAERRERYVAYGKYKNKFQRIVQWLEGNSMYLSNAVIADICNIIKDNKIETVFIEDSIFGSLVKAIKEKYPDVYVITFFHDIAPDLYVQWARRGGIINKIECRLEIRQERINQKYSDVDLVFNKRDAALYQKFYGTEPDGCIPIATPVPEIDAEKASAGVAGSVKELLFVGSKYFPNILGIRWFYENVLPELPESIAVKIVGRGTEFLREEFADPSIQVIGTVDSVDPYYRNADIVFAPLFDGGGMKCKSVEALSYGKIFVGTSESLYGFWEQMDEELRFKYVYLCDTQVEWVKTMRKLCNEKELHKYNEPVFRLFLNKFSDEATKKQFLSFFEK